MYWFLLGSFLKPYTRVVKKSYSRLMQSLFPRNLFRDRLCKNQFPRLIPCKTKSVFLFLIAGNIRMTKNGNITFETSANPTLLTSGGVPLNIVGHLMSKVLTLTMWSMEYYELMIAICQSKYFTWPKGKLIKMHWFQKI